MPVVLSALFRAALFVLPFAAPAAPLERCGDGGLSTLLKTLIFTSFRQVLS